MLQARVSCGTAGVLCSSDYDEKVEIHHCATTRARRDVRPSSGERRTTMGMTNDGLSHWQAEAEGIELLEMTIGDLLDRRADELPTQEAIVYSCYPEFGDALNIRWTYQDYRDRANAVAKGLLALGLAKGDHIAVWAANLPEWLLLQMAAAK